MRRREFVALLGAVVAGRRELAYAQQPAKPRIGVLLIANREPFWTLFKKGLGEVGYIDGQNIQIELRSAEGSAARLPELAAQLVRLKVAIIVATPTPCVHAAKVATRDIPIVMAAAGDPVGTGLVSSLARPGGNITGISSAAVEMEGKTFEIIHEMLPLARRVAVLANPPDPFAKSFVEQAERAARTTGLDLQIVMIRAPDELDSVFAQMGQQRVDAVVLQPSLQRKRAADLALKYRLPIASPIARFAADAGGLLSYSQNAEEMYRRTAVYVDKILKGANPGDLPIEQPTKFELVINLRTANELGLTIPPALLARADEVIE